MLKKILFAVISLILGAMFIFSAYTKLFPIEIFEFSFIEIKVANWTTAPFIARLFLALEFFLGILLLLNWNAGNRLLAKLTILLLGIFTIYLIAIIFFQGNSGNCGCFGNYIKMTPLESIIKNIVLISLASVLLLQDRQVNLSSKKYIILSCAIASVATPFVLNPISSGHPPHAEEINYRLNLDALYAKQRPDTPSVDLMKGKRVIAFLSLTCPHCKIGAQKLNLIHQQNPDLPIYFILNGETSDLQEFLESSKTKDIEYRFMSMQEGFIKNAGINLPAILWVKDGLVENRTKYTELDASELIDWFQNP